MFSVSSIIQTVLSVLELHQISLRSRTITAGRESHPAPKIIKFYSFIINRYDINVKKKVSRKLENIVCEKILISP